MQSVLVCEDIGPSATQILEEAGLSVTLASDWSRSELLDRVADYQALLVRSATQVDRQLIDQASNLAVIGRAGVGVDNIDLDYATARGIAVVNAPESNVVTAAEHTIGLLLALARNIPQAHQSLSSGQWQRSQFSGTELADKTLGIIGFGRIGQLVASRARGLAMKVIAYDPYVSDERFLDLQVERISDISELYRRSDFITIHLPKTEDTENFIDSAAIAQMKDGVRILNVARGQLIVDQDLQQALDSGKVAGAAIDVFRSEPINDHPLFGYANVIVTPHLGASTEEATDRAGAQAAEQVVAVLAGRPASHTINLASVSAEEMDLLKPFFPLAQRLGYLLACLTEEAGPLEVEYRGRLAERDCRPLTTAILVGFLSCHSDEIVNAVSAPTFAEARGVTIQASSNSDIENFADLITLSTKTEKVVGTVLGGQPHLLEVWQRQLNIELADHLALFHYRDLPGMIGKVGTIFGQMGINIDNAAVGYGAGDNDAVMVLTTAETLTQALIDQVLDLDQFDRGKAVNFDNF